MKIENCKLKIAKFEGFTMIELIVVMAIIAILAAAALVNFGKNEDRDVKMEASRFATFLRDVQNKALTGEREDISVSGRLCGFGVRAISNNSFQTYFISTSNLDESCAALVSTNPAGTDYGQVFYLNNKVTVESSFNGSLFFMVPLGTPYYNGGTAYVFPLNISLAKSGSSLSITVEQTGRIY